MNRDDAGPFLMPTIARENPKEDSTVSIDASGATRLMQMGVDDARVVNPNINLGIPASKAAIPTA